MRITWHFTINEQGTLQLQPVPLLLYTRCEVSISVNRCMLQYHDLCDSSSLFYDSFDRVVDKDDIRNFRCHIVLVAAE